LEKIREVHAHCTEWRVYAFVVPPPPAACLFVVAQIEINLQAFSPRLRIFIYYAELHDISILVIDINIILVHTKAARYRRKEL